MCRVWALADESAFQVEELAGVLAGKGSQAPESAEYYVELFVPDG
jgi:hypothetical protein